MDDFASMSTERLDGPCIQLGAGKHRFSFTGMFTIEKNHPVLNTGSKVAMSLNKNEAPEFYTTFAWFYEPSTIFTPSSGIALEFYANSGLN